jgi:hypothetical protein
MRRGLVTYHDDDFNVEIVVRQCTYGEAFRRGAVYAASSALVEKWEKDGRQVDIVTQYAAKRVYPCVIAATVEIRNLEGAKTELRAEISFEEFLTLPDGLVGVWEQMVYKMNPHWIQRTEPEPESEEAKQGEAKEPGNN